jgi:hypothetical protein
MSIENHTKVKLITFLGTLSPKKKIKSREDYWKLIGENGEVIDNQINHDGRVLVLFDKNLNDFEIENHNPIKNSLLIRLTDLEFIHV